MKKILLTALFLSIITAIDSFSLQAESDLVLRARRSMDYVSYDEAVRFLKQALEREPEPKDARLHLAFAYFKLDKHEEAIRILDEELVLFPDSLNANILKGYIRFYQGRFEEAAGACHDFEAVLENSARELAGKKGSGQLKTSRRDYFVNKVRGDNPNFGLPYFILGLFYKQNGGFTDAVKHFRRALELGYDRVKCHTQQIDIDLSRKDWRGALIRSQEALETEGPQSDFYLLRGIAFHELGETENAVASFQKAIELKPYSTECMKNLAKLYLFQNEFGKARPLLENALRLGVFDQEVYSLRMYVTDALLMTRRNTRLPLSKASVEDVALEYRHVFVTDINDVVYGINAAALGFVRTGKLSAAGNLLRRFLELQDLSPELNYNLAQLYKLNKSYGNALRHAWRATELKEDFKDAYDLIGGVYFELQDFNRAIHFYERVIEFDPKDSMSCYNLACACFGLKDYSRAERLWRAAIRYEKRGGKGKKNNKASEDELDINIIVEVFPISFESYKSLGHLYLQNDNNERALEEFMHAIELEPRNPEPYYEVGKIFFELEDLKNSNFYLNKYLSLGGKEEKVRDMIKREYQVVRILIQ